jgi:hypothetical protein
MTTGGVLQTERQVQRAILKMASLCFPRVMVLHIPNGGHLAGSATARFKQMGALKGDGLLPGTPDLLFLWSAGQGAFLEVKRPKTGRLSDAQKAIHTRLQEIRWPVATVTSVEEAYQFLFEQGAPRERSL